MPLRLVVEGQGTPRGPASPAAEPEPPAESEPHDDAVDWRDLEDAPPGLASPLDHVMQAFEGAKVVEE